MLGNINGKFKNAKAAIKKKQEELNLKKLKDGVFPYACLVADDVMLTKNGEVFQMIEILLDDFKDNQEGGLREHIRKAIDYNSGDLNTAFWIQTVKKRKINITRKNGNNNKLFLKKISQTAEMNENSLNNYSTYIYITVIKQGTTFKLQPKKIKDYFFATFLDHTHDKFVQKIVQDVRKTTENIVSMLSQYRPKILGVRRGDGCEYSELIEKLYFLINFEDKQQVIRPIDVTHCVNTGRYMFQNGIIAMKSGLTNKMKMGMAFSFKEVPRITMPNVSDIVNNTRAEMVITEYVTYIDQKRAAAQFSEQKEFLQKRDDKIFQEKVGLSFLDDNVNAKYCKSSISVLIFGNSYNELQSFVAEAIALFSKHGIVMAREDVSAERCYYSMMPANFTFTQRLTVHDTKEIGCFCYSYHPQDCDATVYLNDRVLFNIGTLKGNPVPIGFDKQKPNMIMGGREGSGKTVFSNFMAASYLEEIDANLYIIEFNCRSRAFIEAMEGQWFRVSMDKQNHTAPMNLLDLDIFGEYKSQKESYLFDSLSLLLSANNVLVTPEMTTELHDAIDQIIELHGQNPRIALHDVRNILDKYSIGQELNVWHSIGKYYHLFDNRDNIFEKNNGLMAIHIDETVASKTLILASVINNLLTNITQRASKSGKPTIIIMEEPFLALGNAFFKTKLNRMLEFMAANKIFCIFKIADFERANSTIVDFGQLVNSCGLQIHIANKFADKEYGRVFHLEKLDYMAIKTLAMYEGQNMLVKQRLGMYSCAFDLKRYKKTLSLLSDKIEAQTKILAIKDTLQTESVERWLTAYYGDFDTNSDEETRLALQRELQAIKDVRRLMES